RLGRRRLRDALEGDALIVDQLVSAVLLVLVHFEGVGVDELVNHDGAGVIGPYLRQQHRPFGGIEHPSAGADGLAVAVDVPVTERLLLVIETIDGQDLGKAFAPGRVAAHKPALGDEAIGGEAGRLPGNRHGNYAFTAPGAGEKARHVLGPLWQG